MHPLLRKTYFYDLPPELIAAEPLAERTASRLLVVHRDSRTIEHRRISELPHLIKPAETSIVVNNTKVFRARLLGKRAESGGRVEFFMLKKVDHALWQGLMKTAARVFPGFKFEVDGVTAEVLKREETTAGVILTARFSEDPVEKGIGEVPLPPYIVSQRKGGVDHARELEIYNTTYAKESGSVASPTAGRHFTPALIDELRRAGASWNEITLHVGMGTFKPVTVDDIREHTMHAETAAVSEEVAAELNREKQSGRRVLAVGTTTVRSLEAFADSEGILHPGTRDVNLFIHPGSGYQWKFVDQMLTNFHLPESTLLMMVASFVGDTDWLLEIYREAIRAKYRFYSYGDAMLIL